MSPVVATAYGELMTVTPAFAMIGCAIANGAHCDEPQPARARVCKHRGRVDLRSSRILA